MAKQFISYRYDAVGNRVGMTDPQGGRFTYSYDFMSRLTALQNPQGERTSYIYDAGGRRTGVVNANCTRTSTVYDNLSRVTQVVNQKSDGTVLSSFDYAYDLSGNRKLVVEADGRRTSYTYDAAGQLTGEHRGGTGGYQHTFAYDRCGNRTLKVEDGVRTTFVYDAASQMKYSEAAGGRTTYVYDGDGNQQSIQPPAGGRTTYVWDYENRMTSALLPAGLRNTMAYDPQGLRVQLEETSGTKKFIWDDQNYLAEANAANAIQRVYTVEPRTYGNLVSHRQAGATTFYQFDALGSTRTLTDASQGMLQQYSYGAWGDILGSPSLLTPFLWVGQVGYHWDQETQNQYVRARYYRPVIARWVSVDPLLHIMPYFQFIHSSIGTPTRHLDPSGLARYEVDVVAKSFIDGVPRIGSLPADRDNSWVYKLLFSTTLGYLQPATARLMFLAGQVGGLPAFNQDPLTDVKDGKYRLYTRIAIQFECLCNAIVEHAITASDMEGGHELNLDPIFGAVEISGTIGMHGPYLSVVPKDFRGGSALRVSWEGFGRPNEHAEPAMQWVASRTSVNIWHNPTVEIYCDGGVGYFRLEPLQNSRFPSHRVWVNGDVAQYKEQGAYSDLWLPQSGREDYVAP
jgi:RHS repeat-associated protein